METVVSASNNPELANKFAAEAMQLSSQEVAVAKPKVKVTAPPAGDVTLAGGYYNSFTGDLICDAVVRELTGADEEAVAKVSDVGRGLMTILQRATVSIGENQATTDILDSLLAGDRELLLLEIRKITFGNEVELYGVCPDCGEQDQLFTVDLTSDIKITKLSDPILDRNFDVECKVGTVRVTLPDGKTQKKVVQATDKTSAELDTMLLKDCVESINGTPVFDVKQVLSLGVTDRRKILSEIADRNPGPDLSQVKKVCPSCSQEVTIPLSLVDLFRG
jgi:hypothetical protein